MKRIYIITILSLVFSSCSENFLDTKNLMEKTDQSFYRTPTDADQALTGVYATLTMVNTPQNIFIVSEQMSDECFGGGGQNDHAGAVDQFQQNNVNQYSSAWSTLYQGVFRANTLIRKMPQISGWTSDNQKNQIDGEVHFLRAYFYFDLMRMFGGYVNGNVMGVPLITDPTNPNPVRATADAVYAQIASDLKYAITKLPSETYQAMDKSRLGHATKWAAESLMARVYLFYTGAVYGSNTTLPLAESGTVSKQEVIDWVDDCIANSGHSLIADFRNLWPYSYSNLNYKYSKDNNLEWIGETGNNTENVFSFNYSNLGQYGANSMTTYSNLINLYNGIRNQNNLPFGYGWGWNTVCPTIWSSWDDNDIRKAGSIYKVDNNAVEGLTNYLWYQDKQMDETGYWQKKYIPINVIAPDGHNYNYSCELYGRVEDLELDNTQNVIMIRLSDVLLMGAELGSTKAQYYFDLVRTRVHLPSIPATIENIRNERKHELAFEGIRYWDELRWGTLVADLQATTGANIWNVGVATTYSPAIDRFNKTRGFLPIPQQEISLSNGKLVQNDGWSNQGETYLN